MGETLAITFRVKPKKIRYNIETSEKTCKNGHQQELKNLFCSDCGEKTFFKNTTKPGKGVITTKDIAYMLDTLNCYSNIQEVIDNAESYQVSETAKMFGEKIFNNIDSMTPLNYFEKKYFSLSDFILGSNGTAFDMLIYTIEPKMVVVDVKDLSLKFKNTAKVKKVISSVERFLTDLGFSYTIKSEVVEIEGDWF